MIEQFLGIRLAQSSAGGFTFSQWIAEPFGEAVQFHEHQVAHLMYIVAGDYASDAIGPARAPLIYNPPQTVHRDRFQRAGGFFAVSLPDVDEVELPKCPTRIADASAHALVRRLMRQRSATVAEEICYELLGSIAEGRQANRPAWLRRAHDFLNDCYAEPITIRHLSRMVGVHPIHLTRSFRGAYGCTPHEFLQSRRVQRAADLLVSSSRPLSHIAIDVGFADQSHFTKHFRATFGVPPGEYRSHVSSRQYEDLRRRL